MNCYSFIKKVLEKIIIPSNSDNIFRLCTSHVRVYSVICTKQIEQKKKKSKKKAFKARHGGAMYTSGWLYSLKRQRAKRTCPIIFMIYTFIEDEQKKALYIL